MEMKKSVRAMLHNELFEAYCDYALEPITSHASYYFLGIIHGLDRAITIIDDFGYLSDAVYDFTTELIKHKRG